MTSRLSHPECGRASRRKLDRQGNAIQAATDRDDAVLILPPPLNAAERRLHARSEQPDRAMLRGTRRHCLMLRRNIQCRHPVAVFAIDTKCLPTGRQQVRRRTDTHDRLDHPRDLVDDVLAVVDHNEHPPRGDRTGEARGRHVAHAEIKAQRHRNDRSDQPRVGY